MQYQLSNIVCRICLLSLAILVSKTGMAQAPLNITDNGSKVAFVIKNFGIGVDGSLKGLKGTVSFDASNLGASSFKVSVAATTINTGIDARDKHLRKAEYFDVAKFPELRFSSTRVSLSTKPGVYYVVGQLTIKSVTREVGFPFTARMESGHWIFEGSFKLNRRDYGVGGSSISLSDEVVVKLQIQATQ